MAKNMMCDLTECWSEYEFTLRKNKCKFGVPEVTWFGHVFSKQGMSADPEKARVIKSWPAPKDKAEVKSFLQTVQFSQEYMRPGPGRSYADVTKPLRRLTAKVIPFKWDSKCEDSFQELKSLLCSDTVMVPFEPGRKTRVYVDHGPHGLGATVSSGSWPGRTCLETSTLLQQSAHEGRGGLWESGWRKSGCPEWNKK